MAYLLLNQITALQVRNISFRTGRLLAGISLALSLILTPSAHAQDGKTILVLDASGSMWAQIADGHKISVAQEVINDLLDTLPPEEELGLLTYGHRRKGDCGDIELMVPPGAGTRGAISGAIKTLNPTGRTPLSAAVMQAADELRIEVNPATVILLSDGRETCDLDPCAVGAELEDRGIDFTTHVIGFDVDDEKDKDQLRCLAENTGGKFLTASTASELTRALETVSQPTEQSRIIASVKDDKDFAVREGLSWTLVASDKKDSLLPTELQNADKLQFDVDPGEYVLTVARKQDNASASLDIDLQKSQSSQFVLTLPALELSANLTAPATGPQATSISVEWSGPDEQLDYIAVVKPGESEPVSITRTLNGNPLKLHLPPETGEYEIHYVRHQGKKTLAMQPIAVVGAGVNIESDDIAAVSTDVTVEWTGPDEQFDYIAVAAIGSNRAINRQGTDNGSPLKVKMPETPGEYELRYISNKFNTALASRLITVKDVDVKIKAVDQAGVGESISVEWTGPDKHNDRIEIGERGTRKRYDLLYTANGSPLSIQMPPKPGEYEIRYVLNRGNIVLATRPITVKNVLATLNAPDEAGIGESITVEWDGPDAQADRIEIGEVGNRKRYDLTYTRDGNPLKIQLPSKPGDYEVRYVLSQGNTVLATRPITVNRTAVTLDAPAKATAGELINVEWVGPNERADRIEVGEIGSIKRYDVAYTRDGSPLPIEMPSRPGTYELRYILSKDSSVLATRRITLTEAMVSLDAPDEASAGDSVAINWVGPNQDADTISIAIAGERRSINSTYTRRGNPLTVQMPTEPGEYELRYVLRQGRTTLVTRPITVTEANVSLTAPDTATTGEEITVSWIGPDENRDEIAVAEVGRDKPINRTLTNQGSPLTIKMPPKPGEYELRYVLFQNRTIMATRPITVTAATVTLDAPTEATAGESIPVTWVGPDEKNDVIAIAVAGEQRPISSTRTQRGSPLALRMPNTPGEYEIRYILRQGRTTLATHTITVNER